MRLEDKVAYKIAEKLRKIQVEGIADYGSHAHVPTGELTISGDTEYGIDAQLKMHLESVALEVAGEYGIRLVVHSESNQLEVGTGKLIITTSIDECDGSRVKNPRHRAVVVAAGRGTGLTVKDMTAGVVYTFEGTVYYTSGGKSYKNGILLPAVQPHPHAPFEIAIPAHGVVHWRPYAEFLEMLERKLNEKGFAFNPRVYGATSIEVSYAAEGLMDGYIDIRKILFDLYDIDSPRLPKVYDIAAPSVIARYAGMHVMNGYGSELDYSVEDVQSPVSLIAVRETLKDFVLSCTTVRELDRMYRKFREESV